MPAQEVPLAHRQAPPDASISLSPLPVAPRLPARLPPATEVQSEQQQQQQQSKKNVPAGPTVLIARRQPRHPVAHTHQKEEAAAAILREPKSKKDRIMARAMSGDIKAWAPSVSSVPVPSVSPVPFPSLPSSPVSAMAQSPSQPALTTTIEPVFEVGPIDDALTLDDAIIDAPNKNGLHGLQETPSKRRKVCPSSSSSSVPSPYLSVCALSHCAHVHALAPLPYLLFPSRFRSPNGFTLLQNPPSLPVHLDRHPLKPAKCHSSFCLPSLKPSLPSRCAFPAPFVTS